MRKPKYVKPAAVSVSQVASVMGVTCTNAGDNPDTVGICDRTGLTATGNCQTNGVTAGTGGLYNCVANGSNATAGCLSTGSSANFN